MTSRLKLQLGDITTMNVQADDSNLAAGVWRGVVTLLFQDGTAADINVLNIVAPAGSLVSSAVSGEDRAAMRPLASGCASPNLEVQFTSLPSGFQAVVGKPATVSVKLMPNGARTRPTTPSRPQTQP